MDICGDGYGCETDRVIAARRMGAGINYRLEYYGCQAACANDVLDPTDRSGCTTSTYFYNAGLNGTTLAAYPDGVVVAAAAQCCEKCSRTEGCSAW